MQHCNGAGTVATTDVTHVLVACSAQSFFVGGTVNGLSGTGLVLANGADHLVVAEGATTFTLADAVVTAGGYAVTVESASSGLTCSLANATGVIVVKLAE